MQLKVNFDDEIKEVLNKVFSSMIPNEQYTYDGKTVKLILKHLKKILPQNETYGEYWVLYDKFINQEKLSLIDKSYIPKLTQDVLENSVSINIDEYIHNPQVQIEKVLADNGLETDLTIAANYERACGLLFDLVMSLYDSLRDLAVDPLEGSSFLDSLKDLIEINLYRQSVIIGSKILNEGIWLDKKHYIGKEGYRKFTQQFPAFIKARFKGFLSDKIEEYSFTSIEDNKRFRQYFNTSIQELFKFGYKPLDDVLGVSTSDVVTIVGDEGVGKTNFTVDLAVKSMLEGHSVLFMTGESSLDKIRYMCVARLAYELYGISVNWKEIKNIEDLPESVQLQIEDTESRMSEEEGIGRLHLIRKFEYENFYQQVKEYKEQYADIRTVIVDHIGRLSTTGEITTKGFLRTDKERVDFLYEQAIDIGDDYDLAVVFLAHSNTVANQDTNRERSVGIRIGALSSATSKDSDLVLYLRKNELLNKQGMIMLETKKVREGTSNVRPFVLKLNGVCSVFNYNEDYQIIKEDDFSEEELYSD